MNYYRFHVGDHAKRSKRLTLMGDLAYRRLLDEYFTSEAPLPLDPAECARIIGMREHADDVSEVLSDFFLKSDAGWTNIECDREIQLYKSKAGSARNANKARWNSDAPLKSDVKSEADQILTNNQEPITEQELPAAPAATQPIPADPIFGTGLAFLVRKSVPEHSARAFLGLLRKELRDDLTVAELLGEAERIDASQPQAWLRQAAKQRKLNAGERNGTRNIGAAGRAEQLAREGDERDARREREQFGLGFDTPGGFA